MSVDNFLNLKNLLYGTLLFQNTNYRGAIKPAERLIIRIFEVCVQYIYINIINIFTLFPVRDYM